jgi:hypothetical protein
MAKQCRLYSSIIVRIFYWTAILGAIHQKNIEPDMIPMSMCQPNTRAVIEPPPAKLWLFFLLDKAEKIIYRQMECRQIGRVFIAGSAFSVQGSIAVQRCKA